MSASCVVPREHVLDLLDALREVAADRAGRRASRPCSPRRVLAEAAEYCRADPQPRLTRLRGRSAIRPATQADSILADARHQAGELVRAAEADAYRTVESAREEHESLVSATTVHRNAQEAAVRAAGPRPTTTRIPRGAPRTGIRWPSGPTPRAMPTGRCSTSSPCCGGR